MIEAFALVAGVLVAALAVLPSVRLRRQHVIPEPLRRQYFNWKRASLILVGAMTVMGMMAYNQLLISRALVTDIYTNLAQLQQLWRTIQIIAITATILVLILWALCARWVAGFTDSGRRGMFAEMAVTPLIPALAMHDIYLVFLAIWFPATTLSAIVRSTPANMIGSIASDLMYLLLYMNVLMFISLKVHGRNIVTLLFMAFAIGDLVFRFVIMKSGLHPTPDDAYAGMILYGALSGLISVFLYQSWQKDKLLHAR